MAKVYNRIIGYNTTKCFVKLLQGGLIEVMSLWSGVWGIRYRENVGVGFRCNVGLATYILRYMCY